MNEQNDSQKQESGACSPGCSCGASGSSGRGRWIAGVVILLIVGVLVARAVVKNNGAETAKSPAAVFAALPSPAQTPTPDAAVKPTGTDAMKEIEALSDLNTAATNTVGVFVFLPGKTEATAKAPMDQIMSAARTMEPQLGGGKIGVFALKVGSRDYEQVATQIPVPGVIALVKGRGMAPVSGEITEMKLVQAYVTAASAGGGCGPASGGCGPVGCK